MAAADNTVLAGIGALSLGRACWHSVVEVVDFGLCREASVGEWEAAIERVHVGADLLLTDGSRDKSGRVGGG